MILGVYNMQVIKPLYVDRKMRIDDRQRKYKYELLYIDYGKIQVTVHTYVGVNQKIRHYDCYVFDHEIFDGVNEFIKIHCYEEDSDYFIIKGVSYVWKLSAHLYSTDPDDNGDGCYGWYVRCELPCDVEKILIEIVGQL